MFIFSAIFPKKKVVGSEKFHIHQNLRNCDKVFSKFSLRWQKGFIKKQTNITRYNLHIIYERKKNWSSQFMSEGLRTSLAGRHHTRPEPPYSLSATNYKQEVWPELQLLLTNTNGQRIPQLWPHYSSVPITSRNHPMAPWNSWRTPADKTFPATAEQNAVITTVTTQLALQ